MMYYKLFSGNMLYVEDIVTFLIIGFVLAVVSFFLLRGYFKVNKKSFSVLR